MVMTRDETEGFSNTLFLSKIAGLNVPSTGTAAKVTDLFSFFTLFLAGIDFSPKAFLIIRLLFNS